MILNEYVSQIVFIVIDEETYSRVETRQCLYGNGDTMALTYNGHVDYYPRRYVFATREEAEAEAERRRREQTA